MNNNEREYTVGDFIEGDICATCNTGRDRIITEILPNSRAMAKRILLPLNIYPNDNPCIYCQQWLTKTT